MIKAAKFYDFELLIWIVNKVFEIYVEIVFVENCIMFLTWPWRGGKFGLKITKSFKKLRFEETHGLKHSLMIMASVYFMKPFNEEVLWKFKVI